MGNSFYEDTGRAAIIDELKTTLRLIKEEFSFVNATFERNKNSIEKMSNDYALIMEKQNPSNELIFVRLNSALLVARELLKTMGENVSLIEHEIEFFDIIIDLEPEILINLFLDHGTQVEDLLEEVKKQRIKFFDVLIDIVDGFQNIHEN